MGVCAIVFGILSRRKSPTKKMNAMAKVGLICGIVGIVFAVLALLSMLFGVFEVIFSELAPYFEEGVGDGGSYFPYGDNVI